MAKLRNASSTSLCVLIGIITVVLFAVLSSASSDAGTPEDQIREELSAAGLTSVPSNVIETLSTLEKIDDYPVYTMTYYGPYISTSELWAEYGTSEADRAIWGCSLFAALGDPATPMLGRNFDWEYSPLLVVFLVPEVGNRSVMTVDIAYLVAEDLFDCLDQATAADLLPLLNAPFLTVFDGMNEHGLAIGMASVDYECDYPSDPDKRDVGDMALMREVLEANATVVEAIAFLEGINPVSQGGPNMHYLVADTTPAAALIEYHNGERYVFRSSVETPWQLGTNFPVALTGGSPAGECWRYDQIESALRDRGGAMSAAEAAELLQAVSTPMTRWSIVYDLLKLDMHLVVERDTAKAYTFWLDDASD